MSVGVLLLTHESMGAALVSAAKHVLGRLPLTVEVQELAANADAKGVGFAFKYFQQIKGTLLLPDGFTPNGVRVEADAGSEFGKSSRDFTWGDVLAPSGGTNAGESK